MPYKVKLYKWSEYEWRDPNTGLMQYRKEKDYYDEKEYADRDRAVYYGEFNTAWCDDLFWEVEEE